MELEVINFLRFVRVTTRQRILLFKPCKLRDMTVLLTISKKDLKLVNRTSPRVSSPLRVWIRSWSESETIAPICAKKIAGQIDRQIAEIFLRSFEFFNFIWCALSYNCSPFFNLPTTFNFLLINCLIFESIVPWFRFSVLGCFDTYCIYCGNGYAIDSRT